jgi:hypothetical protein
MIPGPLIRHKRVLIIALDVTAGDGQGGSREDAQFFGRGAEI